MKRLLLFLFIGLACRAGFAQSADTIQLTGKILLIDSFCTLKNEPGKHFYSDYKPYYLVLFKPTLFSSKESDNRMVIRTRSIAGLPLAEEGKIKLKRLKVNSSGTSSSEIINCHDYVLKERNDIVYELVE